MALGSLRQKLTKESKRAGQETPVTRVADSRNAKAFSSNGRQKFTRAFKEAIARSVQQGTPVKEVARVHNIRPAAVREWRDELRDLGLDAFSRNGRRKFTKEFKETAVRRVEQGTPVKEVARACRVSPNRLRRWRDALRDLGADAFFDNEPKRRAVIFRLNDDEHNRLKALAKAVGARSLSDFARSRLLYETVEPSVGAGSRVHMNGVRQSRDTLRDLGANAFLDSKPKRRAVIFRLKEGEYNRLNALAKGVGARNLPDFIRFRLLHEPS